MSNINISDLYPPGYELLQDFESFLNELTDQEMESIKGGANNLGKGNTYNANTLGNKNVGNSYNTNTVNNSFNGYSLSNYNSNNNNSFNNSKTVA